MAKSKNSLQHTNLLDVDVSAMKPMPNKLIVRTCDEEMLRIGNTNLVMGYFDDNRNNTHWFGDVEAINQNVPLRVGDRVLFSFLSAQGCDRIISHGVLYIILDYSHLLLYVRDGEINMLNGVALSVEAPARKSSVIEYEDKDTHYTVVKHVSSDSKFKKDQMVYYMLHQVFELEGQQKTLGETYRVLREENILASVSDYTLDGFDVADGYMLVREPTKEKVTKSGIIIPDTAKKKVGYMGTVIKSSCYYHEGQEILFRKSKGIPVEIEGDEYIFVKESHVEATCE